MRSIFRVGGDSSVLHLTPHPKNFSLRYAPLKVFRPPHEGEVK
jgi:hypothetical protein